jgi:hypothetical protein
MTDKTCLNCGRTANEIPLLSLEYRGEARNICPQCLPVLIHKPQNLVGKLPGAENLAPANHDH